MQREEEKITCKKCRQWAGRVWFLSARTGRKSYKSGLLLPLCRIQNGNCLARKFRRFNVSSSGGVSCGVASGTLFARGCLTIFAVGKAASGELTEADAVTMFGFI